MLVYPGQMQGGPGGQMPGAVPVPGASVYPPQFTYGLQQNYGGSSPLTSMAAGVGSIPTAMSTVGMVAGVGSMFSKAPILRGLSFLDPATAGFEAGAARFGASRLAGAGIGEALGAGAMAGAGPLALGLAAFEGMRYTGQQFMTGAREQQMLGAQLGGIGFANSGAMGGRGFGFGQQRQIGQMMREIDAADPFTTMSSLSKSMDQFTGLGMHRGIEDAKEFAKKFESFAKTTKEMAKIMGKTQEEAGAVFAQMKHSGFYTANDVMGNTRMMGVAKGMGMDEQLFHGMQGQGAGTSRAMGMRGRAGAVSSSRFAADLMMGATSRASGGTGAFSDAELMDITGAGTGAEAAAQMGNQMSAMMGNFLTNTASGRGFMAVLGEKKDGRYTGGLDREMLTKMGGGGIAMHDLATMGSSKMGDAAGKASFMVGQGKIASSIMEDDAGIDALLASISGEADRWGRQNGVQEEDRFSAFTKKVLKDDERILEKLKESQKHKLELRRTQLRKMREENSAAAYAVDMQQNYTVGGLTAQAGEALYNATGMHAVAQAGADFTTSAQITGQNAWDTITGTARMSTSPENRRLAFQRLASGAADMGGGTETTAADFEFGTAGRGVAMMAGSRAELERAVIAQRRVAGGQPVTDDMLSITGHQKARLAQYHASYEGQQGVKHMSNAATYRALGYNDKADAEVEKARALLNDSGVMGNRASQAFNQEHGLTDTALIFATSGGGAGADLERARLFGKGDVKDHSYEDITTMQDDISSTLSDLGVDSTLTKQLTEGGAGSALLAAMGGDLEGLVGLGDGTRAGIQAAVKKKYGGNYTDSDIDAVMKANEQITKQAGRGLSFGKTGMAGAILSGGGTVAWDAATEAMGLQEGTDSRLATARGRLAGVGKKLSRLNDQSVLRTEAGGVAAGLGAASDDLRAALGGEYTTAMGSLEAMRAGGEGGVGASKRILGDLDALLAKAGTSGVGGMLGGGELGRLATQRSNALAAAGAGDLAGIGKAFGMSDFSEQSVRDLIGKKDGALSSEDMQGAVQKLSGQSVFDAMGAGTGGGIFRRGATVEAQMLLSLESLAKTVKEGAETSRILAFNIREGKPILTIPTEGTAPK